MRRDITDTWAFGREAATSGRMVDLELYLDLHEAGKDLVGPRSRSLTGLEYVQSMAA